MRLGNYIHEGESEAVSGRMGTLYEALESPASNVRWKTRAVVFDHQFGRTLMRMQPNTHPASLGQMSQLVFQQIAYHSIQQRVISIYDHIVFEVNRQFMMTLCHCGLINIR